MLQQPPSFEHLAGEYEAFVVLYYDDPVGFVREVLGAEPDEWQAQLLRWIAEGERRISVVSGHGVGKTTALAWAIVWHATTRFPQKTACTAPTEAQLFNALAAETKTWFRKTPDYVQILFEITRDKIYLKAAEDESFVTFKTSRPETPEALAGIHSTHVLLIGDEASGIHEKVFEAASGSMSGHEACTVLAGNPVRTSGLFFDTHHDLRFNWKTLRVSCLTSPRVSKDFVEDMKIRYGEESNAFRVRVLGLFPKGDDNTIIPIELVDGALVRDVMAAPVKRVWGVDCARFGSDRSALCIRQGNAQLGEIEWWSGLDTMQLVGRIKHKWDNTPEKERPELICVDVIGIGAGVVDRLRELRLPVMGINVSESAAMKEEYHLLRTELWFLARDWFAKRDCKIDDKTLAKELVAVQYDYTSSGKLIAESKDDMKKRGVRSPDIADAFVLTFAAPAIAATHGSGGTGKRWDQPLGRSIVGHDEVA